MLVTLKVLKQLISLFSMVEINAITVVSRQTLNTNRCKFFYCFITQNKLKTCGFSLDVRFFAAFIHILLIGVADVSILLPLQKFPELGLSSVLSLELNHRTNCFNVAQVTDSYHQNDYGERLYWPCRHLLINLSMFRIPKVKK